MTDNAPAYWPYYCEENIWQLCADARVQGSERQVWVIANAGGQVACWGQRASERADGLVVWDYHVVLCALDRGAWQVWDLDTRFGLPLPVADYLERTFRPVPPPFAPRFRVLGCAEYRERLQTDRRHMRGPDGRYRQPPPPWPAIGAGSNLDRFIDVDDDFAGRVVDLDGLRRLLAAAAGA